MFENAHLPVVTEPASVRPPERFLLRALLMVPEILNAEAVGRTGQPGSAREMEYLFLRHDLE